MPSTWAWFVIHTRWLTKFWNTKSNGWNDLFWCLWEAFTHGTQMEYTCKTFTHLKSVNLKKETQICWLLSCWLCLLPGACIIYFLSFDEFSSPCYKHAHFLVFFLCFHSLIYYHLHFKTVVLNLSVVTNWRRGKEQSHTGCLRPSENTDTTLQLITLSNLKLWSSNKNNFVVGSHHMRNSSKGSQH